LLPEGGEIYVNQDNKNEYVMLYTDFIFNQHCEEQFKAFKKGFFKVVSRDVVELFRPEELELMVCGSKTLNFEEL
jgi:ubiquitin-protein ligase E3 A